MRIACPSCAAEYEVPASRMASRRMVRCERCGNEWVAVQEAEASPPAAEPADAGPVQADPEAVVAHSPEPAAPVAAIDRLALPRPADGRDVGLLAAWIASVMLLAGAAAMVVAWRGDVVQAWPPSARLLGSPVAAVTAHAPSGAAAGTAEKPAGHE